MDRAGARLRTIGGERGDTVVLQGDLGLHFVLIASSSSTKRRLAELYAEGSRPTLQNLTDELRSCTGAFAGSALLDDETCLTFRDQVGLKPLYYWEAVDTGKVMLSTSFAELYRGLPSDERNEDVHALYDFFGMGYAHSLQRTGVEAIRRIPPAGWLRWDGATPRRSEGRFWSLRDRPGTVSFDPARLRELLTSAISEQLGDGVAIDRIALSGGMDSSSALILASENGLLSENAIAYTNIQSSDDEEASLASEVARRVGVEHVTQSTGMMSQLKEASALLDRDAEPTPLPPAVLRIPDVSAGSAACVLTGFGGDPAANVNRAALTRWREEVGWGSVLRAYVAFGVQERRLAPTFLSEHLDLLPQKESVRGEVGDSFLSSQFLKQARSGRGDDRKQSAPADTTPREEIVGSPFWSSLLESRGASLPGVTHLYPFLDWRLLEYLGGLPPVPWLIRKRVLREAMKRKLPTTVVQREKSVRNAQSFSISADHPVVAKIYSWMLTHFEQRGTPSLLDEQELRRALKVKVPPHWWWPRLLQVIRYLKWREALHGSAD
jgi:asparagine synthase (glutamine-hydrolysing)